MTTATATLYELEVRELAQAAERESERRRAEGKALRQAGIEQMKRAKELQRQSDYYRQLLRFSWSG
jgi:hypothetical protein